MINFIYIHSHILSLSLAAGRKTEWVGTSVRGNQKNSEEYRAI